MRLTAADLSDRLHHLEDREAEGFRNRDLISISAEKARSNSPAIPLVFSPQFPIDGSVPGGEQAFIPEPRALILLLAMQPVSCEQEIVGGLKPVEIESYYRVWRKHNCMEP